MDRQIWKLKGISKEKRERPKSFGVMKMKWEKDAPQDSALQDFADLHSTALQTAAASNETCEAAKKWAPKTSAKT